MTKAPLSWLFAALLFVACNGSDKVPDVSAVKVDLKIRRFDQQLFSIDTMQMDASLDKLLADYPQFFPDYLAGILGVPPSPDSAAIVIKSFITSYKPVYLQTQALFANFSAYEKDLRTAFQFFKYYFPSYELPPDVITFIGPMDAIFSGSTGSYGDVMTKTGPGIGLQLHLGTDAEPYQTGVQQGLLYDYQARRFTPQTIVVNTVKNLVDDAFPYRAGGKPLVEEMIEKGKRIYILDKVLPHTADSLKLGYSKQQLEGCYKNEALIWNYFVKNNLVFSIEQTMNRLYVEDGPKTQEVGEGAPGYIGLFVGWQIVKAYMDKQPATTLPQLMQLDAKVVFNGAKYKP